MVKYFSLNFILWVSLSPCLVSWESGERRIEAKEICFGDIVINILLGTQVFNENCINMLFSFVFFVIST
jgi:hypothetical protein